MPKITKLPKSKIEVQFSVPWEEWERHIDSATEAISKSLHIQGFRSGKAPRNIVERRVGRDAVLREAADRSVRKVWESAVSEEKIEAIGQPEAEITKIAEGNPLEFRITTAVMPEVLLKDGWRERVREKNISEKQKLPVLISESDIDKEISRIAESRAPLITVLRPSKKGDSVRIDFSVSIDGKVIDGGSAKGYSLVLGSGKFIPGFEEQIEGMKENEHKTFSLQFPEKYHDKNLAGKMADFSVSFGVVQERQIPLIDDEFARSLGKFQNLADLKKNIREGMEKESLHKREEEKKNILTEAFVENVSADIPDILLEREVDILMHEFEERIAMIGGTMEEFFKQAGKKREEVKNEFRPQGEKRLLLTLGIEHLAKEENIQASNEEIETEMNAILQYYQTFDEAKKKLDMARVYSHCREAVIRKKAVEYFEGL